MLDWKESKIKSVKLLTFTQASNVSTATFNNGNPTAGGQLVYIPNYSSHGILVYLGGAAGKASQLQPNAQQVTSLNGMDTVSILDVGSLLNASDPSEQSGRWLMQGTSGTVTPKPRADFCVWVAAAPDNSSINIYLYGGWDPTQSGIYYDDIWILSFAQLYVDIRIQREKPPGFATHAILLVADR